MIGLGLSITQLAVRQLLGGTFNPIDLFANSEPGVWYDPSDMSTLFQDAAGATPVTAVEQPVGRMLDKSGNGNHATQATATSRPVLSARINLLTKTEQFDDAVWVKNASTVTANTVVAPDGTTTAEKIVPNETFTQHTFQQQPEVQPAAGTVVLSAYFKADELTKAVIRTFDDVTMRQALFNLSTGTVETGSGTVTADNASITAVGGGWYLCSLLSGTTKGSALKCNLRLTPASITAFDPAASWSGNSSDGGYIWGASLAPADQASLPYQRVNTATDYDTVGFPHYLKFDGIDDGMVTSTITPGTDKAQVFAGVRKMSNAGGMIVESSSVAPSNSGAFFLGGAIYTGTDYAVLGGGTSFYVRNYVTFTAPITNFLTAQLDNGGATIAEEVSLRANGSLATLGGVSAGGGVTGNFLAYPLYIGRRGGTSLPFNGHLYSLAVRFGPTLTETQIEQTETYVNTKTGAY